MIRDDNQLRRGFEPKSDNQAKYLQLMKDNDLVIAYGCAGAGKTACAIGYAIQQFHDGEFDRLVVTRPYVGIGEEGDEEGGGKKKGIGFLPGDIREKMDPYIRPILDELYTYYKRSKVDSLINNGDIEIAPLFFVRGRTFHNSFIICDEAQNATYGEIKALATRLGRSSKMVITGDLDQTDLRNRPSLYDWINYILKDVDGVGICELEVCDIVRHKLVSVIVEKTTIHERNRKNEKIIHDNHRDDQFNYGRLFQE